MGNSEELIDGDAGEEPGASALAPFIADLTKVAARTVATTPSDDHLTLATQLI